MWGKSDNFLITLKLFDHTINNTNKGYKNKTCSGMVSIQTSPFPQVYLIGVNYNYYLRAADRMCDLN